MGVEQESVMKPTGTQKLEGIETPCRTIWYFSRLFSKLT